MALLFACGDAGGGGDESSTGATVAGSPGSTGPVDASTSTSAATSSSGEVPTSAATGAASEATSVGEDTTAPGTGATSGGDETTGDPNTSSTDDTGVDPPRGPPACEAGGQESGSGGAEGPFGEAVVGLCRMAIGCPTIWELHAPPEEYKNKGTPNHKLLWRVWYFGWSRLAGTQAQQDEAKSMLLGFFDTQVTGGHYAIGNADEVLNTSHYQLWANGMTCARLLAIHHQDAELLAATGQWWRGELALYSVLQRGGSIDAPGARFKDGQAGPSQLRDVVYAMVRGAPLMGNPGNPNAPWWSDYYNVAAWTLREVQRLGDDLGGAADAGMNDLPNLHDPLELRTKGDDFVFVFNKLRGALQPLFWVARINGETTYAPYVDGTPVDNPFPPPELPGATVVVIPGSP